MTIYEGGVTGGQVGGPTVAAIMIAFFTLGLYNSLELFLQIFLTFKRRGGLYFWAMIVATAGIPIHITGFLLKYFDNTGVPWQLYITIIEIGWTAFVTGQSMVLYSRLHLVLFSPKILRAVLIMIIFNGIVLHGFTSVVTYGSNSRDYKEFKPIYINIEKVQMTVFTLQEGIISGLYVWATMKRLSGAQKARTKMLRHLIYVNIFVVSLDIVLLGLAFADLYEFETSMKPAIYSVKLKLEFAILNKLLSLSSASVSEARVSTDMASVPETSKKSTFFSSFHRSQASAADSQLHGGITQSTTITIANNRKESVAPLGRSSPNYMLRLDSRRPSDEESLSTIPSHEDSISTSNIQR